MNSLLFALKYGWRSLRRSGQRTLLAMVCVAFGVMSLIAMQTLANALINTLLAEPGVQLGGDLEIFRPGGYLIAEDLALLDQMQADGTLDAYTPLADGLWHAMKLDGSGHVYLVMNVTGIDPATYPIQGSITLREPADATLADVLAKPGSAAITRDLADQDGIGIGDWLTLSDESGSNPTRLQVTAILQTVPDRMGDRILYSLETARLVTGRETPVTSVSLRLPPGADPAPLVELLSAEGWNVSTPELIVDTNRSMRELFDMMLKGAGILGLLVGGIGVANTMQVLLARRTTEIAMLKTLGYRQIDLLLLFSLETGLLGLAGSLLGLGAAALICAPLIATFEQIGSLLLEWSLPPEVVLGGILAGTATAMIFGIFAILRTSAVRPAVLLRNLPVSRTWRTVLQTGAIGVALALPFSLLSSLIMGSVTGGLGVVALALAGFAVLGLTMWLALFVTVRVPLPGRTMLKLARSNLKRGRLRAIFALIALFVGVFAVGFAATIIATAQQEFTVRSGTLEGDNLLIFVQEGGQTQVNMALASQDVTARRYAQLPIQALNLADMPDEAESSITALRLAGLARIEDWETLSLTGQPWGTIPDGVYLPRQFGTDALESAVAAGETPLLTARAETGETFTLRLAGFYTQEYTDSALSTALRGGLLPEESLLAHSQGHATIGFLAALPPERLLATAEALSLALPDAMVLNAADVNAFFTQMLYNLLIAAIAVAGLALVAGAVLIANSVGLAMVERLREIAILKTVGYSRGQVLNTILWEQGLLGLVAGVGGTVGVFLAVNILNTLEPNASLTFAPLPVAGVAFVGVLIALGSAALVAWRPTQVRPMMVLRGE